MSGPDPVAELLAADAATRGLGIAISDVGGGRATARMTVTPAYDVTVWRPADGALIAELRGRTRSPRIPSVD